MKKQLFIQNHRIITDDLRNNDLMDGFKQGEMK